MEKEELENLIYKSKYKNRLESIINKFYQVEHKVFEKAAMDREDLEQEWYLFITEKINNGIHKNIDKDKNPKGYIFRYLINFLSNILKKISRQKNLPQIDIPKTHGKMFDFISDYTDKGNKRFLGSIYLSNFGDKVSLEEGIVDKDQNMRYKLLIDKIKGFLTEKQFKILELRFIENLTLQEIGDKINSSKEAVRQRLAIIKSKLKKHLSKDFIYKYLEKKMK